MTDMKQLRELSDAATQGEWLADNHLGGYFGVQSDFGDGDIWYVAKMEPYAAPYAAPELEEINAKLISTLVNAYRSGQLVHVDEVEKLREALRRIDHLDETKTTFGSDLADAGQIARDALSQGEG